MKVAVQGLVDAGLIELVTPGGVATERDGLGAVYRRVPPVPVVNDSAGFARPGARQRRWKKGEKLSELVDPGILKRSEADGRDRNALQEEFDAFFSGMVSEWNPCYTEDGQCRYRWDAELGAPMPEVEVTAEDRAQRLVNGQEPERVNLRHVLDVVLVSSSQTRWTFTLYDVWWRLWCSVLLVTRSTGCSRRRLECTRALEEKRVARIVDMVFRTSVCHGVGWSWRRATGKVSGTRVFRETTVCAATMSRTCCWPTWVTSIGVQF